MKQSLVQLLYPAVGKDSDALAVSVDGVLGSVGILDGFDLVSADLLDGSVMEDRLFFSIRVDVLFRSIHELDLFRAVFVVELDLVAAEAVDLRHERLRSSPRWAG